MFRLKQALRGLRWNKSKYSTVSGKNGEIMACQCGILEEFFDEIFGDGSGIRICGREKSAGAYTKAFLDFLSFLQEQTTELDRMLTQADNQSRKWAALLEGENADV